MATVLKRDDGYEQVTCPNCHHEWYEAKRLPVVSAGETIRCPKCNAPLHPPVIDIRDNGDLVKGAK